MIMQFWTIVSLCTLPSFKSSYLKKAQYSYFLSYNTELMILIITILIMHFAKPQCVYKYKYRQLYGKI